MNKLQEAAAKYLETVAVLKNKPSAKKAFVAGANYTYSKHKEAILELVSALEVARNYLKKDGYKAISEELDLIIQKHKQ